MTMIDEIFVQRVFERIDKFDEKIDDLCDRMMKVELDVTNHLTTVEQNANRKEKRFYVLIASLGTIFAAVSLFQSFS